MALMTVREAVAADVPRLAVLHVRSWQAAYRGMIPQDYLDSLDPAERAARWTRVIGDLDRARAGIIVAEDSDHLHGFASFGPTRDDDAEPDQVGEINAIYLAAEAWGQGYGRALMAAALERLAGAGFTEVTLWVLDANARAQRFYAAAGFRADGAVKIDDRGTFQLRELRYRRSLP
jgi:RimJ/RimL family protein N-acetyltransferase